MYAVPGYALIEVLHDSPRSRVHRARRVADGRQVILKRLGEDYPTPAQIARFEREHRLCRALAGAGIAEVLALAPHEGTLVMVFEDIGASSLDRVIAEGPLPPDEVLHVACRLAEILGRVHASGVTHKDLNPANVVYRRDTGAVRVIDFGCATELPSERGDAFEGTLAYVSPEQTGRMNREVDHRTDFYALGATLHELCTGAPPFSGNDALELFHAHLARVPPRVDALNPAMPRMLAEIVQKLLAKTPEVRYQTAAGLLADLERCRASEAPFPLGRDDVSERFHVPEHLHGREDDVRALLDAFARASAGGAELCLVKGDPGIGKSSLVREVERAMVESVEKRGYVAWGKFDAFSRDVPYTGLLQALAGVVRQMLAEDEDEIAGRRRAITAALGPNGGVVAAVIPDVERIAGPSPPVPELPPYEAQIRFNFTFRSFVGALLSPRRPLVLVLDDLQWADLPSLKLLELMTTDGHLRHLLIVGAYRDNEVDALHPLALTLRTLDKAGVPTTTLAPGPLGLEHVARVVADTLRAPAEEARPIAAVCLEKTAGNPFFLRQFLRALHEAKLLVFDRACGHWRGSVEAIRAAGITDNVIDLMVARIRGLPEATQEALRLAACLGSTFSLSVLATVSGRGRAATSEALWPALAGGVVVPLDAAYKVAGEAEGCDASYRFVHDRVQQAVDSLLSPEALAATHLEIGRLMRREMPAPAGAAPRDDRLFTVVSHLNLGAGLIDDPAERDALAELDLAAGTRMRDAAAYAPALRCLTIGRSLLGDRGWERRHDLMLALTLAAAEAADLTEGHAQMDALCVEVIAHARTLLEKVPAYLVRLHSGLRRRRHEEVVAVGAEVLRLLGVDLPAGAGKIGAGLALARMKLLAMGRSIDDLAALPPMTDPLRLAAMRVLVPVGTAAYLSVPDLLPVVCFEQLRATVRHGHNPESSQAYSGWGLVLCAALGDYDAGLAFGRLAVRFTERPDAARHRAQAIFNLASFMLHWTRPLRETLPLLLDGYQDGLASGNLTFGVYCAIMRFTHGFFCGLPLEEVAAEGAAVGVTMRRVDHLSPYVLIVHQAAENLLGRAADPCVLTGAVADERAIVAELEAGSDGSSSGLYRLVKLILAFLFGDLRAAAEHAAAAERHAGSMMGLAILPLVRFFAALAGLPGGLPGDGGDARASRRALRSAEATLKKLRGWARHAPSNHAHRAALLEAEIARAKGRQAEAREGYDRAVDLAREGGHVMEEALANELAARFYLAIGRAPVAAAYAMGARQAYRRWGAAAKVKDLEVRHPELFRRRGGGEASPTATTISTTTTDGAASDTLDFMSVLKASQAISGEIVQGQLLETLMRTLLESAGARRGLLLFRGDAPMVVELDEATGGAVVVREGPGDGPDVPVALVRYVERTLEQVVIGDTRADGRIPLDAYLARRPARSALAMPVLRRQRLVAVLYLENDLVADAFTPARCRVLEALSGQAAISLENARLYDTLESRVKLRTQELSRALEALREAQRRLIVQEKLTSLSVLTAGIAHEIKNPLNFVNNFAELSAEIAGEIGALAARAAPLLGAEDAEALADASSDLAENVTRIQEHGRRAAGIVSAMLAHSQARVAETREVDLNALVREHADAAHRASAPASLQRAARPPATLAFDLDPALRPLTVMPEAIGQVVRSLVGNAVYFARAAAAAPAVTVSTKDHGDRVEVRVRDNGAGIPDAARDKVFTPFFTTKPTGEGTGLGLFIAYDIVVQGHGGTIDFESAPGRATELVVSLPRSPRPASAPRPPE